MKMTSLIVLTAISLMASAQSQFTQPTRTYLMHSSGLHLKRGSDGIAKLEDASATKPQQVTFVPVGGGFKELRDKGEAKNLIPWDKLAVFFKENLR